MRFVAVAVLAALALSAQTKKVLVMGMPPAEIADLQSVTNKARVVAVTRDNVMAEIADADAFVGGISPEMVKAGKNLKWVQIMSAGVETVLHKSGSTALRDSDIVLTNNQIVQGPEIADHAFAMLLALTRHIPMYIEDRKNAAWRRTGQYPGIELRGRTGVVIGVGGIGMQIAIRAHAFGMKVVGVDPEDVPFLPFLDKVVKPDQLDEVIPDADVVFISAPHTTESNKMFGTRQFDLMKKDSYFIAVSRGGLYDMGGLAKALDSKRLAGAGVDVTDPEPLPTESPLWKFDNIIITPHIAGRSDKDRARMVGTIKENVKRFAEGKPLLNVVDKKKGY